MTIILQQSVSWRGIRGIVGKRYGSSVWALGHKRVNTLKVSINAYHGLVHKRVITRSVATDSRDADVHVLYVDTLRRPRLG